MTTHHFDEGQVGAYITLNCHSGCDIPATLRQAAAIANMLQVDVRFAVCSEKFVIHPGIDPEQAVQEYSKISS